MSDNCKAVPSNNLVRLGIVITIASEVSDWTIPGNQLVTPADNSPFALSVTITEKLKEAQR
jgi:hypothetical protein